MQEDTENKKDIIEDVNKDLQVDSGGSEKETEVVKGKDYIDISDFSKVEVLVGEIIECEKVENADRLLKLKVNFGLETRQIVSGIAEFYQPEELIGKKCPFVTNLKPRMLKGLESQGMIMAAKDGENFSLLEINTAIKNGTRIS